jgi:phosphatidylethanolamine-binding protein (PEBP) family uncharacterized protein
MTLALLTVGVALLAGCGAQSPAPAQSPTASQSAAIEYGDPADFAVTSADIGPDGVFDDSIIGSGLAWCDGPGESVALEWTAPPEGTQSLAIVMNNTTREFNYWIQYDIEPTERSVEHGMARKLSGVNGTTSVAVRYPVAPCPEVGETHEIVLTVYALDTTFDGENLHLEAFKDAAQGHILAQASVTGTVSGPSA